MRPVLEIRNESGTVICSSCRIADTFISRLRGLLGRKSLRADEALLISPAGTIHTFFMRFAIDVVFLQPDLTVLATREPVRPWRTAGCRGARMVLELPAGACRRWRVRPGDRLELADRSVEKDNVVLVVRDADGQVVVGRGPISAASRTISALSELEGGVSAVLLREEEPAAS